MTARDATLAEFDRLLAKLCDAELTANDLARLERLVLESPALRIRYLR